MERLIFGKACGENVKQNKSLFRYVVDKKKCYNYWHERNTYASLGQRRTKAAKQMVSPFLDSENGPWDKI